MHIKNSNRLTAERKQISSCFVSCAPFTVPSTPLWPPLHPKLTFVISHPVGCILVELEKESHVCHSCPCLVTFTSLVKYLGVQGLLSAALCFSSPRCLSSSRCLCSVASSMFPSFRALVTCCHSRLQTERTRFSSVSRHRRAYPGVFCLLTWTLSCSVAPRAAASSW